MNHVFVSEEDASAAAGGQQALVFNLPPGEPRSEARGISAVFVFHCGKKKVKFPVHCSSASKSHLLQV